MAKVMSVKRAKELQIKQLQHIIQVGDATGRDHAADFFDITMEYCKHRIRILEQSIGTVNYKGKDQIGNGNVHQTA